MIEVREKDARLVDRKTVKFRNRCAHQIQTMEVDCEEDVPITFVSYTEVISSFCRINYRLLRKAYETGRTDLSYLSAKASKDPSSEDSVMDE